MFKRKDNPSDKKKNIEQPNKKFQTSFVGQTAGPSWRRVSNDARQAMVEGRFKEAVVLFTSALVVETADHISLLDSRAASYEKLKELELGLSDALTMIKNAPNDSRGYLRTGKLLTLQKKHDEAMIIYNRGTQNLDPKDTKFSMITRLKEQAEISTQLITKFDPTSVLPFELFSIVFSHLPLDCQVKCTAVSKQWRNYALNWSGVWRNLEFRSRRASQAIVAKYLQYAQGPYVRSISIHSADRESMTNVIRGLINEECQNIETIDFNGCDIPIDNFKRMLLSTGKYVKHLRLDGSTLDTKQILDHIIPVCPELTHLSILDLPNTCRHIGVDEYSPLKKLTHLRCNANGTAILQLGHELKSVEVYSDSWNFCNIFNKIESTHKNLKEIIFTGDSYKVTPKAHWMSFGSSSRSITTAKEEKKGILSLELSGNSFFSNHMASFFIDNPNIESLILDCYGNSLEAAAIDHISFSGLPCLRKLKFPKYTTLAESQLEFVAKNCPLLEEIYLPKVNNMTDNIMNAFATNTKKLRMLDISDCNNVTGIGLEALVHAHRYSLQQLVISNCQKIGPDSIKRVSDQLGVGVVKCELIK